MMFDYGVNGWDGIVNDEIDGAYILGDIHGVDDGDMFNIWWSLWEWFTVIYIAMMLLIII